MISRLLKSLMTVNVTKHYYIYFLPVQISLSFASHICIKTAKINPRNSGV